MVTSQSVIIIVLFAEGLHDVAIGVGDKIAYKK
jgi:hypothetical protein